MKIYDVAIMGGGPGGLYAHYYAHTKGMTSVLIEANNELGGQPTILFPIKAIHDYPGYENIPANELMNQFIKQANFEKIVLNTAVEKIEQADGCYRIVTNKEPFFAKHVIIATGGGFFKFNKITGVESKNIHYVVKDLNLYKNKKVIVAGGGDAAID
ncbi:MAG: NAD(P)/FAD-dependent oxidoreductase [Mycoplasmoidaceae bacterium]|nr:NAD(P)/FAD-dependent oxidoreductase [Mycoplasmoidaceae bacterium]